MKLSKEGAALLKQIEVLALQPYDDQLSLKSAPIKNWVKGATIGYGYLIPQNEWDKYKNGITEAEADSLFNKKIAKYEYCVDTSVVYKDLTQQEFDACVILCYNIGTAGFANSSVCKMLNGQKTNYKTLDDAWMAWNKSQGNIMKGLTKRRQSELDIFHKGVYKGW